MNHTNIGTDAVTNTGKTQYCYRLCIHPGYILYTYIYIIMSSLLYSRELYYLLKKIDIVLPWKTGQVCLSV